MADLEVSEKSLAADKLRNSVVQSISCAVSARSELNWLM